MKPFQSYTSFTRTERNGILALSAMLVTLIIVRVTMSLWVHPDMDKEQEEKMVRAWKAYKKDHVAANADSPFRINLNAADSATLVQLKGIGPAIAHKIITDRNNEGPFTDLDQLWEMGSFSETTIEYLEKHLYISADTPAIQ